MADDVKKPLIPELFKKSDVPGWMTDLFGSIDELAEKSGTDETGGDADEDE